MRWITVLFALAIAPRIFAGEVDLPPRGEGPIAFDVDVCSFRWRDAKGFEEITLRFPVAQFAFEQRDVGTFVSRYRPSLRVLNAGGEIVQHIEAESQMTAKTLAATTDPDRTFLDMVQVRLKPGAYRAELTLSDLIAGRSGVAIFAIDVPQYDVNKLGMSDLYLSSGFNPPGADDHLEIFRKGGRIVVPNPSRIFELPNPLWVFFEVYHLGYRAHDVAMQVLDRYGHAIWQNDRSFPGNHGDASFAEGIPLSGQLPGDYTLRVTVSAGQERAVSARRFRIARFRPLSFAGFDDRHTAAARDLLGQFGEGDAVAVFDRLDRVEQARFVYGFWKAHNPIVAESYYGPLLGENWPEASPALLSGLGLQKELARRVDRAFAARLSMPDTAMARQARDVLGVLQARDANDVLAQAALGYAYFAGGDLPFGERFFHNARGADSPEVYNGIGLAHLGRKNWAEAQAAFAQALELRPGWSAARSNVFLARFLSGKGDWVFALDSLLASHARDLEWWYAKGRLLERQGDLNGAEQAYVRQLAVNPMHARARFDLARVWFRQGRYAEAASIWQTLVDTRPKLRDACMDALLNAYLKLGDVGRAQAAISAYLQTVDDSTRALMEDIRLVASAEEMQTYASLAPEDRPAFVRAFWQRRDPTPVTPGNERLVAHYRRVLHAMTHFSSGQKPWDRRGEIYIRYGPPAHVSKSDDVRYETDADVVAVKERLLMGIPFEGRKEIVARMGRLRTSNRDVQYQGEDAGDLIIADFESIDFELNPNRTFFGGGAGRNDGKYYDDVQDSNRDRGLGTDTIRGYPLFPIDSGTRWEYWIYPDVAGGIEIDFTALDARGNFDFPDMPQGRVLSNYNQGLWTARRPDRVVASAVRQQAEIYRPNANDLDFYFDATDFRGDGAHTRLEVYAGVPLQALVDSARLTGQVERGIALFDSTWTPRFRKTAALPFSVDRADDVTSGMLLIDDLALTVPPGVYHLGIEVRDRDRNLMGAYTRELQVEPYVGDGLMLSDIELAGSVTRDSSGVGKGGYAVLPMPSKTYRPGQPVTIYYEVYGLKRDDFGQTHYQMDYQISPKKGKPIAVTILRAIGQLLGIEEKKVVTISYEQFGTDATEYNYLEIDVSGSESGRYELEVRVTDLTSGEKVSKRVVFGIGK